MPAATAPLLDLSRRSGRRITVGPRFLSSCGRVRLDYGEEWYRTIVLSVKSAKMEDDLAMTSPTYSRSPSGDLMDLLAPEGLLAPLTKLNGREVAGVELDLHLRTNDEVQVYCGLARVLNVRRNRSGTVRVSAHKTFREQFSSSDLFSRRWETNESREFKRELEAYLAKLSVARRHIDGEGSVQFLWSRATEPWLPFDREAVLTYRSRAESATARQFDSVDSARAELEAIVKDRRNSPRSRDRWTKLPGSGREVDQVAIDSEGRLALLEFKDASAGPSSVYYTPLQLLQYVWEWHAALESVRDQLQDLIDARVKLGLTPGPAPRLDGGIRAAVCFGRDTRSAEVKRRYDRVMEVVNRHLPCDVPPIETWALEHRPVPVRLRVIKPSPSLRRLEPFAERLQAHLEGWRSRVHGSRGREWGHWAEGIYREYRGLAGEVVRVDGVRLHSHAAHLRSSQIFAFNLFLPFRNGGRSKLSDVVSGAFGTRLFIEEVRFEWVPPGALLGEIAGDRPVGHEPATAVDIALWGRLNGGSRAAVLLEVKLSETDFTHCQGRTSRGNLRRDVCDSARKFFDDPKACYLRRPLRKRRDRRYWEIFEEAHGSVRKAFPRADLDGACPFAFSMQQPMRNLAVARGLEQCGNSEVERAWFGLCAHDDNPDVARHWEDWRNLLPEQEVIPSLPASKIVRAGEEEGLGQWATWMRDRYRL